MATQGEAGSDAPPRLLVSDASKTFGGRRVLHSVELDVRAGEIHALIGQNGSGKSTLAKILSGFHRPDPGCQVAVDGEPLAFPLRPARLRDVGVAIVYQDLGLLDDRSVVENVRIAHLRPGRLDRRIRWSAEAEQARAALDNLGCDVDLNVAVSTLAPADRARVAMARALQGSEPGRGLIIFDESTKALQPEALDEFYATVRALVDRGTSVLLISHRLDEVVERADRVTILRDGRVMHGGVPTATLTEAELASRMLGKTLDDVPRPAPRATAKPAVRIEGARLSPQGPLLDLAIGRGEIVGVTGLAGSGFEELPYVLAGARPAPEGRLSIGDRTFDLSRPRIGARIRNGIVLVPERRVPDGVSIAHDIQDNVTLPRVDVRGRKWFIGNAWQRAEAGEAIDLLGVTPRDRRAVVGNLSGGNQQKVLLGRWLVSAPNLLLLHEPTQAVDVQARSDILTSIVRAAEGGCCVLLASSEAADLVAICDRICLMRGGTVVEETPGGVATEHVLNKIYGGGVDAPAVEGPAVSVAPKEAV